VKWRCVANYARRAFSLHCAILSSDFIPFYSLLIRVFLYAPREDKVRQLLARGKSTREAEELVDAVDRERAHFMGKYFNAEWPDRVVYHTMMNTTIGDECVANMILSLMQTYEARCLA